MNQPNSPDREGLPPFVSSWNQLYTLIVVTMVVLIGLFYVFMITFQ